MQPATVQRLLQLNLTFYEQFAADFSATRQRLQPGVMRLLTRLAAQHRILDLGCGNGELLRKLAEVGFHGEYVGLDFSPALLEHARQRQPAGVTAEFKAADLGTPGWVEGLAEGHFSLVTAFAALHHLPGAALRRATVQAVRALLAPGGLFIHSNWQFLNSDRLRQRLQTWQTAGIEPEEVDPGDYLMDWRRGGSGLRYVHQYNLEELRNLAAESGFYVEESFYSDGESGDLGLYQIWKTRDNWHTQIAGVRR